MRVFISGIRGFLGSNLARRLAAKGHDVGGLDVDPPETAAWDAYAKGPPGFLIPPDEPVGLAFDLYVADVGRHAEVARAVQAFNPDAVIHLAAVSTVGIADQFPLRTWRTNVMGTVNVLEACRERNTPVVCASSDKAYGENTPPFLEETPLRPMFPYDVSKACADHIALAYARTYGLPCLVTRACNYYGPADLHWNRLVPRTFRCVARGESPVLYKGMESVRREWMHVDDACDAYALLAEKLVNDPIDVSGRAFNIGSGDVLRNEEMVRRLLAAAGSDLPVRVEESGFPELGDEWLQHPRIAKLGWEPKVPLEDGLQATWRWYRSYFDTFGKEG